MATYQNTRLITATATAETTVYRFVNFDGSFATTNGYCDGVCGESVQADQEYPLIVPDGSKIKIEASGVIADQANIAIDADGKAKTATSGQVIVGKALQAASADGDIITAQFLFRGAVA